MKPQDLPSEMSLRYNVFNQLGCGSGSVDGHDQTELWHRQSPKKIAGVAEWKV